MIRWSPTSWSEERVFAAARLRDAHFHNSEYEMRSGVRMDQH